MITRCTADIRGNSSVYLVARHLQSAYLPAEDTGFCLVRAATAGAVRALNDECSFALDRN